MLLAMSAIVIFQNPLHVFCIEMFCIEIEEVRMCSEEGR